MVKQDFLDFILLLTGIIFSIVSIISFNFDYVLLGIVSLTFCLGTFFRTTRFAIVLAIIFLIGGMLDLYYGNYVLGLIFLVISGICFFIPYEVYEEEVEKKEHSKEKYFIHPEIMPEDHYIIDRKFDSWSRS